MKKFFLCLLIFALCFTLSIFAEKNYSSEKVVFLPQDFYVGDLVELRIKIILEKGLKISPPESLPDLYWIKIESANVVSSDNGYELQIFLRSFSPGIRTLPPIRFGDITLRDTRIQTLSVLEETPTPVFPIKEQLQLPGTNYYFAILIGLFFVLPVFIIASWTNLKKRIKTYIEIKRRRKVYKKMISTINYLQDNKKTITNSDFFTVLINDVKLFLSHRSGRSYTSATVRECEKLLEYDFKDMDKLHLLPQILRLADEVKFGDREVSNLEKNEALVNIRLVVDAIDLQLFGGHKNVGA